MHDIEICITGEEAHLDVLQQQITDTLQAGGKHELYGLNKMVPGKRTIWFVREENLESVREIHQNSCRNSLAGTVTERGLEQIVRGLQGIVQDLKQTDERS